MHSRVLFRGLLLAMAPEKAKTAQETPPDEQDML